MALTPLTNRQIKGDHRFSDKQRAFVRRYLIHHDATKAAIEAGYKKTSAYQTGAKLLKTKVIQTAIGKQELKIEKEWKIEARDVLQQLYYCLTRDASDFADSTGKLITDVSKLNARARASINAIEQEVTTLYDREGNESGQRVKTKLRLVPKEEAIRMAMTHKGMFLKPEADGEKKYEIDWEKIRPQDRLDEVEAEVEWVDLKGRLKAPPPGLIEVTLERPSYQIDEFES